MTQVDTSIYGNMLRPVKSVQEYDQDAQQAEGNKLGLLLQRGQYDAQQRGVAEDNAFRNALSSGADDRALMAASPTRALAFQEGRAKIAKEQALATKAASEAKKTDWEFVVAKQAHIAQLASSATDQTSWTQARKIAELLGADVSQVPEQFDPATAKQFGSMAMTQAQRLDQAHKEATLAETASNNKAQQATAARNASTAEGQLVVSRQRLKLDQQAPKGHYDSERGTVTDLRTGVAQPVTMGGQPLAPRAKAVAATEDERKAVGWFNQADNAWKNMQAAMGGVDPKTGGFKNADVARPGIADAIAAVPSFGIGEVVGNTLRSPERQKFNQGASSLSEAILRAATGAGVNRDEALQKVRELTPVFGEDSSTTKQKMDSIPMYLNSLKQRAGRAMSQPGGNSGGASGGRGDGWSIEEVK